MRHHRRPSLRAAALGAACAVVLAACGDDAGTDPGAAPAEQETDAADDATASDDLDDEDDDGSDDGADLEDGGDGEDEVGEDEAAAEPAVDPAEVGANELGEIPVLMYHRILPDGGSEYDLTPDEFRGELEWLYEHGYRPITTLQLARGEIDVPAGTTPVVLTFDDSTREQIGYTDDGEIDPDTAVGIMLEVAERHDEDITGSFYVITSSLFGGTEAGVEALVELDELGFEVANHTHGHNNLRSLDAAGVQKDIALNVDTIREHIPDAEVATFSLPLGIRPEPVELAFAGEHEGTTYDNEVILLVGAHPTPSPFHADWSPQVPRIRSSPAWDGGEPDYGSAFWLGVLENNPERKYVSDGDPDRISFPAELEDQLHPDHAEHANPY
jgi:peptidoglycan/xylan/chitin deacetylase (PgdA/CDA1 family)